MESLGLFFGAFGTLLFIRDFKFSFKMLIVTLMMGNFVYYHKTRVLDVLFILFSVLFESLFAKERVHLRKGVIFLGLFSYLQFNKYFPAPTLTRIKTSGEFFVGHREFRVSDTNNVVSVFYPTTYN